MPSINWKENKNGFIDELSTKFTKMVKKIGEKSEELVGLGKLNYEIYKEEDTVKAVQQNRAGGL